MNYIDGHWIEGIGHEFVSKNPVDNTIIWRGQQASLDQVQEAFYAAMRQQSYWGNITLNARMAHLQAFAEQVEIQRSRLVELIALETGKPFWEAETEAQAVVAKIKISIQAYEERTSDKSNHDEATATTSAIRYKPQGVMAVLGPFNFPAHLSNGHIVPALLAGNTIVYKPSELTPYVAEFIVQCWHHSGLPKGVLNLIQGDAAVAKQLLSQDIQGVAFTGSYRAGLAIHQSMSHRPEVMVALEMGGNNPLIVDELKNMPAAIYQIILSSFITAGQRCSCARRLMLPNSAFGDEIISQLITACQAIQIGAPNHQPEPFMGPVISDTQAKQHLLSQQALQNLGGKPLLMMQHLDENSGFLTPGLMDMTDVKTPPDEEIFAPFIQIYRYDTFEQALDLANQTKYGLAAGLLSDKRQAYEYFSQKIRAGLIYWNRATTGASSQLPFGGVGHSGNHRPSAYFAADYCTYPTASLEQAAVSMPPKKLPGLG